MTNQINNDIIQKLKSSDKSAFNIIFNKYYDSIFNNIYYKTHDYEIARDLTQETFIKCWQSRHKIDSTKSFFYWLITIASNLTNNYFKREQMKTRHHDAIKAENNNEFSPANEKIEVEQLQQQIDYIVSTYLPKKCQVIFILSRFEGKSNSEIAESLAISKKTVENQLYEALKIIRKKLKKSMGVYNFSFVLI